MNMKPCAKIGKCSARVWKQKRACGMRPTMDIYSNIGKERMV